MSGITTTFKSTHDLALHGCDESIAAASDDNPVSNIKPFPFCSFTCRQCNPVAFKIWPFGSWRNTAKGTFDAGDRALTEDSYFFCITGFAKVEFEDAGQDSIHIGVEKTLEDLFNERTELEELLKEKPDQKIFIEEMIAAVDGEIQTLIGSIPFNLIQQVSSHNSFDKSIHGDVKVPGQFPFTHSFEYDIHLGNPGIINWFGDKLLKDNWYIYHNSGDTGTNYQSLSEGLKDINELGNNYPITLFVDFKNNPFNNQNHTPGALDQLIKDNIDADKLWTEKDHIDWANAQRPGNNINNISDAVAIAGWPPFSELQGKVMLITTGAEGIEGYRTRGGAIAYTAPKPHFEDNVFIPDENSVFYNLHAPGPDDAAQIEQIRSRGFMTRGYWDYHADFFDPKDEDWFKDGVDVNLNFVAANEIYSAWARLGNQEFPFNILEDYTYLDCAEGPLAVVTGATLTCPRASATPCSKFNIGSKPKKEKQPERSPSYDVRV